MRAIKGFLRSWAKRKSLSTGLQWLSGVLWLAAPIVVSAQPNEYIVAPSPVWVTAVEAAATDDALLGQIRDGVYYLLSDTQIRTSAEGKVAYKHFATKAINAKGLDTVANIEIPFDPSYQSLILHSIDIVRDGQAIHKLADAQVRILQRETELDARIYDGSKTANVFLDDVRVGDTVEYAYSVNGSNPVFRGVTFGSADLQYGVPAGRIYLRLLLPMADRVAISPFNTTLQPVLKEYGGYRDYVWDTRNVSALAIDPNTPGWYDPYGAVRWSGYADWAAVAQWAKPLYQIPAKLSPELQHEVDRIAQSEKSQSGRLLAALRFVQSEIRYLGVEIGSGSHAPNPPSLVFSRRFGDCKDKTLLLISMLDRLGIEAQAALVNTRLQRGLLNVQPSPVAFDHVLVHAKIDARSYWIDPTRSNQRGDLAHLYQPDYDYALVVDSGARELTSMKAMVSTSPQRSLHAVFDAHAGFDKPVRFKFVSVVYGAPAESLRSTLASSNLEDLQKQNLNYYARYYPGITVVEPMTVMDDATNNSITTTESYDIANFSTWSAKEKRHTADIGVPDIDDLLRGPPSAIRKAPLWLAFPHEVTQVTEVLLPEDWPIKASTTKIEDAAFLFERTIAPDKRRIVFTDHYRSLVDEIAAQDVVRYAGSLARAREATGYQLYWADPNERSTGGMLQRFNWLIALLGVFALAGWAWFAILAYRYDPPVREVVVNRSLRGIRGWLVLPAFGVTVTPFLIAVMSIQNANGLAADTWAALTTYGSPQYDALWAPSLLFELVANLGLLVFSVLLAVLFFQRRRSTPFFYVTFLVAHLVVRIIDRAFVHWLTPSSSHDAEAVSEVFKSAVGAIIWGAYFLNSQRVKSTFIVDRMKRAIVTEATTSAVT